MLVVKKGIFISIFVTLVLVIFTGLLYFFGFFHFLYRVTISNLCNENKLQIEQCSSERGVFANGPLLEAYSNDLTPQNDQDLYMHNGVYLGRFGDKLLIWTTYGIVRGFQISSSTEFNVALVLQKNDKKQEVINRYVAAGLLTSSELPAEVIKANPELGGVLFVNGANISRDRFMDLIRVGTMVGVVYAKEDGFVYKFTLLDL